ncbi:hypothetical protein ACHQM5_026151 [Ranunculus cassubicifolius]
MALRWLIHSVCTSAFGYNPNEDDFNRKFAQRVGYPSGELSFKEEDESNPCKGKSAKCPTMFQMPLHYPRYKKADYEKMEEWKVDLLLKEYGMACNGTLEEKRSFAMGAFLWPQQY